MAKLKQNDSKRKQIVSEWMKATEQGRSNSKRLLIFISTFFVDVLIN